MGSIDQCPGRNANRMRCLQSLLDGLASEVDIGRFCFGPIFQVSLKQTLHEPSQVHEISVKKAPA